jgi:hypothetical protein
MTLLTSVNPDIKLRDCVITGTHDSGTYGIKKSEFLSSMAITQNFSFYQQATMGVRLFDMRWTFKKDMPEARSAHGFYLGNTIEVALKELRTFLD